MFYLSTLGRFPCKNPVVAATLMLSLGSACDRAEADLQIERLPDVQASIPTPPALPPAPFPVTYPDGSRSIFGARSQLGTLMNQDLAVTAYIVDVYRAPDCDRRQPGCRIIAPHVWVADSMITGDALQDRSRQLRIVGYAENQEQVDEAVADAARGRYVPPDPETGLLPVPTDFAVGNKVKINGRFTSVSSSGFTDSSGVLEYRGHETLEAVAAE